MPKSWQAQITALALPGNNLHSGREQEYDTNMYRCSQKDLAGHWERKPITHLEPNSIAENKINRELA